MKLTFASNKLREVILHGAEPTVVLLGIAESNTEKAASSLERSHSSQEDSVLSSDVSGVCSEVRPVFEASMRIEFAWL
jgi:hypothetical protein